jgi:hypothetical protein
MWGLRAWEARLCRMITYMQESIVEVRFELTVGARIFFFFVAL